jgi:hypothetical protein
MKPGVYLETTIVSYLTARPSRDLIIAAHQELTREWWENKRTDFDLYVAQCFAHCRRRGSRHRLFADPEL